MLRLNANLAVETTDSSGIIPRHPQGLLNESAIAAAPAEGTYLRWSPVLPAGRDMGNNTGVCLFADIDSIDFDDTLSWVKTSSCSHSSFKYKWENCQKLIVGMWFISIPCNIGKQFYFFFKFHIANF